LTLAWLPNAFTLLRLVCVPAAVWLILEGRLDAAFWLFVMAGITDAIDGFLARILDARSQLGSIMDPLADKCLLVGAYLALAWTGHLPVWLVVLVVLRDVLIVAGAIVHVLSGVRSLRPLFISKVNTVTQIILPSLLLAHHGLGIEDVILIEAAIWMVAVTTTMSGLAYMFLSMKSLIAKDSAKRGLRP
jgi:cardiolipin synthase